MAEIQLAGSATRADRARWRRTALALAWATIAWNSIEAIVAIASGAAAGSIALVGFGLNSIIEVGSAVVVVWQFSGADVEREERALKLIAGSFFLFAAYVTGQALWDLVARAQPEESVPGIVLAACSLVVMPVLAIAKRRLGRRMASRTVVADGGQTLLCSYLSAVLLVGLVANAALGWWWADPVAALVIAGLAVREGREAWRGETCCDAC
ncbi:MAG: cation transporter [Acidimicrobiales bacterium]